MHLLPQAAGTDPVLSSFLTGGRTGRNQTVEPMGDKPKIVSDRQKCDVGQKGGEGGEGGAWMSGQDTARRGLQHFFIVLQESHHWICLPVVTV